MTDVEQVFQLVVDFLRRKGLVAIATKLESSERAKIGKLSDAPTRLEALLIKGIALEEQESKSWDIGEEDGEPSKTLLDSVKEDEDETGITDYDINNKNTLPKHVKSKAKQMGLSKSMTHTSHTSLRTLTPMIPTSIQRSDAPVVSILARADANKAVIRLPSRVTYRHSREPHTPLRTLNKERRAASVVFVNRSNEPPLPISTTSPSNLGGIKGLTIKVDAGTPLITGSPVSLSSAKDNPLKINESSDEHSDEDGLTIGVDGVPKPKETNGPATRGPFEIYPKPEDDDSDSETTKESDSDDEEDEKDSKSGTDPSIFSMDLEDMDTKPDPKPSKRLNFSIKNATNIVPPKLSSSKKKPELLSIPPPPKKGQTKTLQPVPPPSGTTNTTTTVARSPPAVAVDNQVMEVLLNFSEVNLVSNPGDPKLEYFNLKIIYQVNHTGFEESRDFPIRLHDIVAGRYEITGYIGSAAFSRAVNCIDHKTGQSACMKIIKNNKDFFDQCLDELKLLKFIKASGDTEKFHVLEMYDYFYFKEHLFIVCELLGDNLYEFYKKNMSNPNEPHYFTLSRVQKVTRQCLYALQYIHSLGLIHCDLKPENILMKNVDTCEIKVIDFGSSCFTTDVLSTYVQSRSYRAPEVILGLPYGQKIDLWSLGCILAELLTGRVIFQNYSVVTLLARIIGIIGPIPEAMLQRGSFVNKYFMEDGELYENTEIITPKKTTLQRRTKTDDALFLDFLRKLLTVDPNRRPTASESLQHPWLKKVYT